MNIRPPPALKTTLEMAESELLAAFEHGELASVATPEILKDAQQSARLTLENAELRRSGTERANPASAG